jgi:hypothetical protein
MGSANPKRSPEPIRIRCSGCRRAFAWTDGFTPLRNKIYCSEWCMSESAVTLTEERTDQWRLMRSHGWKPVAISKVYGVAHSQVYVALR